MGNDIAVPELIRALNLFPACTVTVGESETRPIVQWVLEDCPSHSSSSLLGEGSSSFMNQSHCFNLRKNLMGNPG